MEELEGLGLPPSDSWADSDQQAPETFWKTVQNFFSSATNPCIGGLLLMLAEFCMMLLYQTSRSTPTPWATLALIAITVYSERSFSVKLCFFLVVQIMITKLLDYQFLAVSPGLQNPGIVPRISFEDAYIIWSFTFLERWIHDFSWYMDDSRLVLVVVAAVNLLLLSLSLMGIKALWDYPTKQTMIIVLHVVLFHVVTVPPTLKKLLSWAPAQYAISKIRSQWKLAGPSLVAAKQFGLDSYAPPGSFTNEFLMFLIYFYSYFFLSEVWKNGLIFLAFSSALKSLIHTMDCFDDPSLGNLVLMGAYWLLLTTTWSHLSNWVRKICTAARKLFSASKETVMENEDPTETVQESSELEEELNVKGNLIAGLSKKDRKRKKLAAKKKSKATF